MSSFEVNVDFYCLAKLTFSTCFLLCRKHLLLLPKQLPGVKTPKDLRRGHLETLREIHSLAARVAAHLEKDGGSSKVGYHALPSMEPLHLHIMVSSIYAMQLSGTLFSNDKFALLVFRHEFGVSQESKALVRGVSSFEVFYTFTTVMTLLLLLAAHRVFLRYRSTRTT